jgi:putative oxidoreductase
MIRFLARLQPWTLFLLRIALGVAMVYNSWSKVYPPGGFHHGHYLAAVETFNNFVAHMGLPRWLGYFSTVTEFLGGLCLIVGLLTRFWGLMVAINMIFAIALVNAHHGYSGSQYSIALTTMALMLFTAGSGAISLDRRFGLA